MRSLLIWAIYSLLFITGCEMKLSPTLPLGRIIVNESINGVKIGDDTTTVIQKLGRPNPCVFL